MGAGEWGLKFQGQLIARKEAYCAVFFSENGYS